MDSNMLADLVQTPVLGLMCGLIVRVIIYYARGFGR